MMPIRCLGMCLGAALLTVGCGTQEDSGPAPRPATGAAEAAKSYFEALVHKDWPAAYKVLDTESKSRFGEKKFAKQATAWRSHLGFEPTEVRVTSCDERNDQAIAHVVLKGLTGAAPQYYPDGVGLSRGAAGWAVNLPQDFGRPPQRPGAGAQPKAKSK